MVYFDLNEVSIVPPIYMGQIPSLVKEIESWKKDEINIDDDDDDGGMIQPSQMEQVSHPFDMRKAKPVIERI